MRRPKPAARPRARRRAAAAGKVTIENANGCVRATLERAGARNRVDAAMAAALIELAERIEDDDGVLMLELTGAGGWFCAGFESGVSPHLVESLAVLSKPTVALINGDAIDEGLELAMALDIRAARDNARLALTQLRRGALPRFGGTQRLPRLAGPALALRMLLLGEPIDTAQALRAGLITYLGQGERGLAQVGDEIRRALMTRAPIAARLVKEAVRKGYDLTLDQGIRLEEDLYALLQTTADRAEGVRAFLEKRKPLFRGT